MAVPSFDDLLAQARQISQYRADLASPKVSQELAQGLAGVTQGFLNAPTGMDRATYVGAVNPRTGYSPFPKPVEVGGSVAEMFAHKIEGEPTELNLPPGSFPVTQKQIAEKSIADIFKPRISSQATLESLHGPQSNEYFSQLYNIPGLTGQNTFQQLGIMARATPKSKTLISNNEFNRRRNAGEVLSTDEYQVVPESYAGAGSPIVEQNRQKIIKSYQDALLADPTIKELKDQGLSLQASQGLVDLARQGNTVAFASLGAKQAKVMGERGMLSENDVTRYVQSGSLSRSAADKLLKWIQGTPTDATLDEINQISVVLKDSFEKATQPYVEKHARQMSESMGIPLADAYRYLAEPMPKESSQKKGTVEEIDVPGVGKVKVTH